MVLSGRITFCAPEKTRTLMARCLFSSPWDPITNHVPCEASNRFGMPLVSASRSALITQRLGATVRSRAATSSAPAGSLVSRYDSGMTLSGKTHPRTRWPRCGTASLRTVAGGRVRTARKVRHLRIRLPDTQDNLRPFFDMSIAETRNAKKC